MSAEKPAKQTVATRCHSGAGILVEAAFNSWPLKQARDRDAVMRVGETEMGRGGRTREAGTGVKGRSY